jgi:hypothetical protein
MTATEQERFWSHVIKGPLPDDCWIWTGAISDDGYGRFWTQDGDGQKVVRPQRYAYEQATGQPLPPRIDLLHSCDIPICVHATETPEESHLFEGTHRVNMIDRTQKGRDANRWSNGRLYGTSREERVQRSRAKGRTAGDKRPEEGYRPENDRSRDDGRER